MWYIEHTVPPGSQIWVLCEESKEILKAFTKRGDKNDVANIAEQVLRTLGVKYGGVRICFLDTHEIKPS